MSEIQNNHPCNGKDCKECETCIFDEDLFLDKVQPNKKNKENMSREVCNGCVNLERHYEERFAGRFDAACKVCSYEAIGLRRSRRIALNVSFSDSIPAPNWCPLKPQVPYGLPSPSTVSTSKPNESDDKKLSYSDKRELMKELPKHIKWEDIKEGNIYVIPKILSQSRKIVKVINKTEMCCSCHEISETTGTEYQYLCSVYPSDLDAVFITEIHNF